MASRMPGPLPTLREQITELKRERRMRDVVYPSMVSAGRLVSTEAARRNDALDAAIGTLMRLQSDLEFNRERIARHGEVRT